MKSRLLSDFFCHWANFFYSSSACRLTHITSTEADGRLKMCEYVSKLLGFGTIPRSLQSWSIQFQIFHSFITIVHLACSELSWHIESSGVLLVLIATSLLLYLSETIMIIHFSWEAFQLWLCSKDRCLVDFIKVSWSVASSLHEPCQQ